ncbi:hypothetical protein A5784_14635 [Mycobacterium sp. 852013-50091_SCH5140682]|nr:hypothetical protein A5784_14635 [Mycobacterium sp. 852013-50091_SCH5140682]
MPVFARLFDIRNIVGALLGIFGVLLTIAGFAPAILGPHEPSTAHNTVDLYVGTSANWWVGLVLIAVSATFIGWALLRPVPAEQIPAETPTDTPD